MCEKEFRCDYLTPAFWQGALSSKSIDDFRDLLTEIVDPGDLIERIKSAIQSGYTLGVFNGAVAFGSLGEHEAELLFPVLEDAFDQCSLYDHWEEQGGGVAAADLALTLNLIQMEILGSIGRSGLAIPGALSLLVSALKSPEDSLHFVALESLRILGRRASRAAVDLKEYLDRLDQLELPVESVGNLKNAADHALGSSS
jgi:hypothetical protein